jgi:dephospho-CoA kinase
VAPQLIGLTGGIAAGKSEALAAFERCGAAVLSTDHVTHELLATDAVRDRLVERWGQEVAPGGTVDREKVAEVVFGRPEELRWLESVIHPLVGQRIADWRCGVPADAPAGVIEVPLLFESGLERAFDATVAIVADPGIVAERASTRGPLAGSKGREDRQLTAEEKARRADHVIVNDGTIADLEESIRALLERVRAGQG